MYRVQRFSNTRLKSKYRNKYTMKDGQKYHSKFEAKVSQDLDFRVKAGELTHYDRQVKIDLRVNDQHITNYYIDFVAYRTDGVVEYIEVKGLETEAWRIKWKLFEVQYKDQPNIELIVIKR